MIRDIWVCITMFTLFPGVVTPFWSSSPDDEFYMGSYRNVAGVCLLGFASCFGVLLVIVCIPLFMFLPGPVSALVFVTGQVLLHLLCFPLQGPSQVWSKRPEDSETIQKHARNANERWFFLNGCCVSGYNLQQNVDLLSRTFGRPVFAIHNRTYGVLGDLFECILQRSFNLFTEETRVCYEYVKAYCTDPEVKKVVLIAHSQGCIMASQILDQLYVDIPASAVSKLEVYTFGNAASHFNNPLRTMSQTPTIDARDAMDGLFLPTKETGTKPKVKEVLPERIIPYIEHYCNSEDMVTRWGALYSAKQILQNRFCGHIFINDGQSGHMLNQHYLSKMFPIPEKREKMVNGVDEENGAVNGRVTGQVPFLDRVIRLDTATVTQRKQQAVHQLAIMRHDSALQDYDDHSHSALKSAVNDIHCSMSASGITEQDLDEKLNLRLGEGKMLTSKDLSGAEGSRISVVHNHTYDDVPSGRTVRQLSRLWRYMDGADPDSRHWVK
ncbi:hypothetical protein, variant [Verruconis gallopava]|nr:hypothetical protein, variant [Verruconis gallopava]KIW03455.1 hypothetical protein, variant [Verruconis gallopava]